MLLLLKNLDRSRFEPLVLILLPEPFREELQRQNIKTYMVKSPWWLFKKGNMLNSLLHLGYNLIREPIALFEIHKIIRDNKSKEVLQNSMIQKEKSLKMFDDIKSYLGVD